MNIIIVEIPDLDKGTLEKVFEDVREVISMNGLWGIGTNVRIGSVDTLL